MVATLWKFIAKTPNQNRMDPKHVNTGHHQTSKEERSKYLQNNHKTISKFVVVSSYLAIITLNINELNSPNICI
jgi:hypothetical protein